MFNVIFILGWFLAAGAVFMVLNNLRLVFKRWRSGTGTSPAHGIPAFLGILAFGLLAGFDKISLLAVIAFFAIDFGSTFLFSAVLGLCGWSGK